MKLITDTKTLSTTITRIINEAKEWVYLVSPFIGFKTKDKIKWEELDQAIDDALTKRNVTTIFIYSLEPESRSDEAKLEEQAEAVPGENQETKIPRFLKKYLDKGCNLFLVPRLHAKIFCNEREALVTSLNLIYASVLSNYEIGTLFSIEDQPAWQEIWNMIQGWQANSETQSSITDVSVLPGKIFNGEMADIQHGDNGKSSVPPPAVSSIPVKEREMNMSQTDSLHLGEIVELFTHNKSDVPFMMDPSAFGKHAGVFGMTGSGKTFLCKVILEEFALHRIPVVIFAVHHDMLKMVGRNEQHPDQALVDDFFNKVEIVTYTPPDNKIYGKHFSFNPISYPTDLTDEDDINRYFSQIADAITELIVKPPTEKKAQEKYSYDGATRNLILTMLKDQYELDGGKSLLTLRGLQQLLVKYNMDVLKLNTIMEPKNRTLLAKRISNTLLSVDSAILFLRGTKLTPDKFITPTENSKTPISIIDLTSYKDEAPSLINKFLIDIFYYFKKEKFLRGDEDPPHVLIFLDEAEKYAPQKNEKQPETAKWIKKIFSEGRKYGVSMLFSTQHPENVLSEVYMEMNVVFQGNTRITNTSVKQRDFIKSLTSRVKDAEEAKIKVELEDLKKEFLAFCNEKLTKFKARLIYTSDIKTDKDKGVQDIPELQKLMSEAAPVEDQELESEKEPYTENEPESPANDLVDDTTNVDASAGNDGTNASTPEPPVIDTNERTPRSVPPELELPEIIMDPTTSPAPQIDIGEPFNKQINVYYCKYPSNFDVLKIVEGMKIDLVDRRILEIHERLIPLMRVVTSLNLDGPIEGLLNIKTKDIHSELFMLAQDPDLDRAELDQNLVVSNLYPVKDNLPLKVNVPTTVTRVTPSEPVISKLLGTLAGYYHDNNVLDENLATIIGKTRKITAGEVKNRIDALNGKKAANIKQLQLIKAKQKAKGSTRKGGDNLQSLADSTTKDINALDGQIDELKKFMKQLELSGISSKQKQLIDEIKDNLNFDASIVFVPVIRIKIQGYDKRREKYIFTAIINVYSTGTEKYHADCAYCGARTTSMHICNECKNLFCDNCTKTCTRCGKETCKDHYFTCMLCKDQPLLCSDHELKCNEPGCGALFCDVHKKNTCKKCGKTFCEKHLKKGQCSSCSK